MTRERLCSLWYAGSLVLLQLVLLAGFRSHLDVNVWDESHYLRQGQRMAAGLWSDVDYAWSPSLAAVYALGSRLPDVGVLLPDVLFPLLAVGSTLALWWALRALVPVPAAFLIAAWWAGSSQLLSTRFPIVSPSVYTFGLLLGSLALGCVVRGRWLLALTAMIVATLNRGEYGPWTAAIGLAFLWLARRHRSLRAPGFAFAGTGLLLTAALQYGWRARSRIWFAFRQHFALGSAERGELGAIGQRPGTAFDNPEAWVEGAFGDAGSVGEALARAPGELARHVLHNVSLLPGALRDLLLDGYAHLPVLKVAVWVAFGGLTAAFVIRGRRFARDDERASPQVAASWAFALAALAVLPVNLLLRPRPDLLLALVPLGLLSVAHVGCAGARALSPGPRAARSAAAFPAVLVILVALLPSPYAASGERPPYRAAIDLARDHLPDGPCRLLGPQATAIVTYARKPRAEPIDLANPDFAERNAGRPFADVVRELEPDFLVVVPASQRESWRYPGLLDEPTSGRWRELGREGSVLLLERVP